MIYIAPTLVRIRAHFWSGHSGR